MSRPNNPDRSANRVTMQDLARELSVSHATVSYVLNGKATEKKIPPETVQRVLQAARRHRFVPNYWAQSLVKQQPRGIGVLFPDLRISSAHETVEGIDAMLQESAEDGLVQTTFLAGWFWDTRRERREIEALLAKQVAGLISIPHRDNLPFYQELRDRGFPVVFVCDTLPGFDDNFVMLDGPDAVRQLLDHLAQLGHRRIALIGPDGPSVTQEERYAAARQYFAETATDPTELMIFSKTGQEQTVYDAVDRALALTPPPTAILAINDAVAYQVMHRLFERNLRVGRDLALVGIGDLYFSRYAMCELTTIRERRYDFGRSAAAILLDQIAGNSGPTPGRRIRGDLLIRASSGQPIA